MLQMQNDANLKPCAKCENKYVYRKTKQMTDKVQKAETSAFTAHTLQMR